MFYGRYASHKAGKSLAEPSESDLCFDACVKTNKELLLINVTKEPAELAILLELLMFEKVSIKQYLEHEQKKEGKKTESKNNFFSKGKGTSDT